MREFLEMGGYAAYVWPSYGIALAVLAGLLWLSLRDWRRNRALLERLEGERRSRRNAGDAS